MERQWKLGDDLHVQDTLLDGVTFDDLITAVHCNCKEITEDAVMRELRTILEIRKQDMKCLLRNNMREIMRLAGRNVE